MRLRGLLILLLSLVFINSSYAAGYPGVRTQFLNNKAVICAVNLRTFNAKDTNGNGIIDNDEESGNFINAVERLDEIKALNINTLHLLPITPTGKLKSLGTAGCLYSMSDFWSINHQLVDMTSSLTPVEQAKYFVDECHKRGIKVIVDLPSCGAYDLFLSHPELFLKDRKQLSVIPSDWTDVRLFNAGKENELNQDLIDAHKRFIDMVLDIGADGLRADVATIKPFNFWKEIIKYTRDKNQDFMFIAEASDSWREPPSKYAPFTPYNKLLEAGFDGYYGSFFNLKDWKTAKELINHIQFNNKLLTSYPENKSVILSFITHDEISPIVLYGENYSVMICWLEATLPYNPYIIDGFQSGDDYIYPWTNTKALMSETDDDYYFVHRGKMDIFNFSRKPGGKSKLVTENFKQAFKFRADNQDLIAKGTFSPLKCNNDRVFAYSRSYQGETLVVIGNLDQKRNQRRITVKVPGVKKKESLGLIHGMPNYRTGKNKIYTDMEAGEIKVLRIADFSI